MKIHKDARLEKICSTNENAGVLQHINIVRGDPDALGMPEVFGRAVATDGRRLVIVPVSLEDGDHAGLITPESLVLCRKLTDPVKKTTCTRMVLGERSVVADNTATFPRKRSMQLVHEDGVAVQQEAHDETPDEAFGKRFPEMALIDLLVPPKLDALGCVRLNPKMLVEIAAALGSEREVTLSFYSEVKGGWIRVDGHGEIEGAVGILMPNRTDGGVAGFELLVDYGAESGEPGAGSMEREEAES